MDPHSSDASPSTGAGVARFFKPRAPMPQGAWTPDPSCYTDPAVFAAEMERFFARDWFCAAREESVAAPGSYQLIEFLGESFILLRDHRNLIHCHYNVCRHRGTKLCDKPQGRFAQTLACPYHNWTYHLDGRLAGAPHMENAAEFRKEDFPLISPAVALWNGFVWLHLGDEPPPLAELLAPASQKFAAYRLEELRTVAQRTYQVQANWKLIIQNYSECLHCPTNHPLLSRYTHYLSGDNEPFDERFFGGSMDLYDNAASLTDTGCAVGRIPDLTPEQQRRVAFYVIMPNLFLSLHPDYVLTHHLRPLSVNHTEIVCSWLFHEQDRVRHDFDPAPAVNLWEITNREDWRLSELMQQGLTSRAFRRGPYSPREDLLWSFDRFIRRATNPHPH